MASSNVSAQVREFMKGKFIKSRTQARYLAKQFSKKYMVDLQIALHHFLKQMKYNNDIDGQSGNKSMKKYRAHEASEATMFRAIAEVDAGSDRMASVRKPKKEEEGAVISYADFFSK